MHKTFTLIALLAIASLHVVVGHAGGSGRRTNLLQKLAQEKAFNGTDDSFDPESVINGYSADGEVAKYMAYVETTFSDGATYSCSGTVVSIRAVMTAAHCVTDGSNKLVSAVAWVGSAEKGTGNKYTARVVYIQSEFSAETPEDDLAVIIFSNRFSKPFLIAELPPTYETLPVETLVYAAGFGLVSNEGAQAKFLQTVILRVEDTSKCAKIFGSEYVDVFTLDNMFCVTDPRWPRVVERGPCSGDSGGPMFVKRPDGKLVVYGALSVSLRGDCVKCGQRSFYTNTATRSVLVLNAIRRFSSGWTRVL